MMAMSRDEHPTANNKITANHHSNNPERYVNASKDDFPFQEEEIKHADGGSMFLTADDSLLQDQNIIRQSKKKGKI
jgi:hypothetical protein